MLMNDENRKEELILFPSPTSIERSFRLLNEKLLFDKSNSLHVVSAWKH